MDLSISRLLIAKQVTGTAHLPRQLQQILREPHRATGTRLTTIPQRHSLVAIQLPSPSQALQTLSFATKRSRKMCLFMMQNFCEIHSQVNTLNK